MAPRKRFHQYALAGWIHQFLPFSSWLCDFQVPHTSCLDDKNRFPQGWAEAGDNVFCEYLRTPRYSVSSIKRNKMLLTNVNMIKSLFRISETSEKGFKAISLWQIQQLMLCHWWHQDSTVICNPVSQNSEHGLPTEQRDWEVDWFEVTRKDQSRSFSVREKERGRREWRSRAEHRYTEVTSVIRWSNWGKTINHEEERGLLHESNPMLLRGSRGENVTVEKLQKRNMGLKVCSTLQAELSDAHTWQCHQVGCTVRSDCWWPEGKEPLVQIFLKAFHVSLDVPDMRSDILKIVLLFWFPPYAGSTLLAQSTPLKWVPASWQDLGLLHESSLLGLFFLGSLWASQDSVVAGEFRETERRVGWGLFPEETLRQDSSI